MPEGEPAPTLGEATGNAVSQVMEAARRDGAAWADRTEAATDNVDSSAIRNAWQAVRDDPVKTSDAWLASRWACPIPGPWRCRRRAC